MTAAAGIWFEITNSKFRGRALRDGARVMGAFRLPLLPASAAQAAQPPAVMLPLRAHQLRSLARCLLIERDAGLRAGFGTFLDYRAKGGVLADPVGMGKTAVVLALVLSEPRDYARGANLVVAPSHLLAQWADEAKKFAGDAIDVLRGVAEYEAALAAGSVHSHTLVLVDQAAVLAQPCVYYNFRRAWELLTDGTGLGRQLRLSAATVAAYRRAAIAISGGYSGPLHTGPLHMPDAPGAAGAGRWRRVLLDEVQDLCVRGTPSQDSMLQLARTADNVWLVSATPFPQCDRSAYANGQLLGFARLDLKLPLVEVPGFSLPAHHPFELMKRQLYIRNPESERAAAVGAGVAVRQRCVHVKPTPAEAALLSAVQVLDGAKSATDGRGFRSAPSSAGIAGGRWPSSSERAACVDPRAAPILAAMPEISGSCSNFTSTYAEAVALAFGERHAGPLGVRRHLLQRRVVAATNACRLVGALLASHSFLRWLGGAHDPATGRKFLLSDAVPPSAMDKVLGADLCIRTRSIARDEMHLYDADADFKVAEGYNEILEFLSTLRITEHGVADECMLARNFVARSARVAQNAREESEAADIECERAEEVQKGINVARAAPEWRDAKGADADRYGSKVVTLVHYVCIQARGRNTEGGGEWVVVFSHEDRALKAAAAALAAAGVGCAMCAGSSAQMATALSRFARDAPLASAPVRVLLCSSRRGASGANLQHARHLVLMDVPGDSAEEAAANETQALGRVLRMGCEGPINVVRLAFDPATSASREVAMFEASAARRGDSAARDAQLDYLVRAPTRQAPAAPPATQPQAGGSADAADSDDDCVIVEVLDCAQAAERKRQEAERRDAVICLTGADAAGGDSGSPARGRHGQAGEGLAGAAAGAAATVGSKRVASSFVDLTGDRQQRRRAAATTGGKSSGVLSESKVGLKLA